MLREVDKLDKRGAEHVRDDAGRRALRPGAATSSTSIWPSCRCARPAHADALAQLDALGEGNDDARAKASPSCARCSSCCRRSACRRRDYALNLSIARGLDYYTGTVYETTLDDYPQIGSICSGGRYENLAGHYTKSKLPGVGISIGATRLFWQLREAGLLDAADSTVQVLVALMDDSAPAALRWQLASRAARRRHQHRSRSWKPSKLAKQFQYADRAGIRFVVVLRRGRDRAGVVTVKDLRRAGPVRGRRVPNSSRRCASNSRKRDAWQAPHA